MLGDRMEMAHSIEGRVPFLDHHVVEVIRSQPVSQKIRGMTEKYVLREAVRDVVSDTVYRRQKHPFLSPPATLNPEERLSTFVRDTLRGPVLASIPYFDQSKVIDFLDRLETMDEGSRAANDQVLMLLVSACVLHERFRLAARREATPRCGSAGDIFSDQASAALRQVRRPSSRPVRKKMIPFWCSDSQTGRGWQSPQGYQRH
jgi:hypothetical protein